jgi:DNA-binding LacI/PurR family transcriptional regulator
MRELEYTPRKRFKQSLIVSQLRARIVAHEFPPESRLPTHTDLQHHFKASVVTVQRALDHLRNEGFVYARRRSGTFVTEYPPHLYHFALVFPKHPSDTHGWSRFWTALSNEAARFEQESHKKVFLFHNIDGHSDREDYQKLLAAVRTRRLAGIVFAAHPYVLADTQLLRDCAVPSVSFMPKPALGISAVALDSTAFIEKALDHLAERGRRRIAVLSVPGFSASYYDYLGQAMARRQLQTKPCWLQCVSPSAAEWARNLMLLLMQSGQAERPDGLIITDDNLVEYAVAGLVAAGVRVPRDLEVVGHCNFPWPPPSVLPITRLGFDAHEVLRACLEIVSRRGPKVAPIGQNVEPVFEDQLCEKNYV